MTRFAIDRKNRDRRGGHNVTLINDRDCGIACTVDQRVIVKRKSLKILRRQNSKAINEGIAAYYQDLNDLAELYTGYDIEEDYDYQEWINDDDEPEPYDDYYIDDSPFDYSIGAYSSCGDPYCSFCGHGTGFESSRHNRSDARLLDQDTTQRLASEVQRGMVSLDLEVIENRDAGKSLGQLLRERLSRPF